MKILVTVEVPDGDVCDSTGKRCELWYRGSDKECYCLLFGFKKLKRRYKEPIGTEILKCSECMMAHVLD